MDGMLRRGSDVVGSGWDWYKDKKCMWIDSHSPTGFWDVQAGNNGGGVACCFTKFEY